MRMDVMERDEAAEIVVAGFGPYEDPLDADLDDDAPILTTRRGLIRLALVASEVASRFAREGRDLDPMAWVLAPRRMFDDRPAIEACLRREGCMRAVLLHGLGLNLDADPSELDWLLLDDGADAMNADGDELDEFDGASGTEGTVPSPRLWTALVVSSSDAGTVQGFEAVLAVGRDEAMERVLRLHPAVPVPDIELFEGFEACEPLTEALLSPVMVETLRQVADDPTSPLAEGLSISVRQRFSR